VKPKTDTGAVATIDLDQRYRELLTERFPETRFFHYSSTDLPTSIVACPASVLLYWGTNKSVYPQIQQLMPSLAWIHVPWVGTDWLVTQRVRAGTISLTNSPGAATQPVAEYVLAAILAELKDLHQYRRYQGEHRWRKNKAREACTQRLLVVGLGSIGKHCAMLCKTLGMRVHAVTRRPAPHETCDSVQAMSALGPQLEEADFVLVTLPSSQETIRLFCADIFAKMKPGACLINIGRGDVVDEPALMAALNSGRLKSAYLDVLQSEPLPTDSTMWDTPNLFLTPHVASWTTMRFDRSLEIFVENLSLYMAGRQLAHQIVP
jgi:D-2-hydroxyacid dehydrogenase (NADP+)